MSSQRRRNIQTPRELAQRAGRLPAYFAVAVMGLGTPFTALAQNEGLRDPMKPTGQPGKPQVVVSEHNTVDLHVKDEDLANVLQLLSMQTQKNIIASKNVSARVTATLYGVTFYEALDAILHVNGFGYIERGNFIYVYTNDELKQIEAALKKRVAKVIRLNYLNSTDAKIFAEPLLSKDGGQIQTAEKTAAFTIPENGPIGRDDYALTSSIVVIDFEENIAAIEDLLRQIDTRPSQVLIEATILQTSLNEQNAFGLDFSIIGDLQFTDFLNIGGPLGAANGLIRGGTGAAGQGLSPGDNQGTAVVSSPGNTSGPGTFKVGVVAGDLSIFLKLLDTVTDTNIVSNPKLLTLNRQPARVLVGTRVGYLSTTATETSTTQTVEFLDTGTQLYFRPFVSSDNEIRMELKPQVSTAEIRTVTDSNGAAVTIPDEITQEIVTNVNVRDGQTIVLGGLFTETQTFNRRQVPFLGDIPIVGTAFRGNDDQTNRSEIIFLVTPSIVTDQAIAAAAERAESDMERLRAGARQGMLPWSRERMTAQLNIEAEKLAREGKYDRALWLVQRSLSLNPRQSQVYRLRERITGERERWPNPSKMNDIFGGEQSERLGEIEPADHPHEHKKPWHSVDMPRERVENPGNVSYNPETMDPTAAALVMSTSRRMSSEMGGAMPPAEPRPAVVDPASMAPEFQMQSPAPQGAEPMPAAGESAVEISEGHACDHDHGHEMESTFSNNASMPAAATEMPMTASNFNNNNNNNNNNNFDNNFNTPSTTPAAPTANDFANANPAEVINRLDEVRTYVGVWSVENNGNNPPLGAGNNGGWEAFVVSGLMSEPPVNTYVGGPAASKVVIGFKADTQFHQNYGWVFNPETGQVWAAGFDGNDQPFPRTPATTTASVHTPMKGTRVTKPTAAAVNNRHENNVSVPAGVEQTSVTVEDVTGNP